METFTIPRTRTRFFILQYPAMLRLWHWLTFLFITASMVTVLLASTLFQVKRGPEKPLAPPTQQAPTGQADRPRFDPSKLDPATRAAFGYRHQIWDTHKIIGFGLCFLLLSRVLIEVTRNRDQRLGARIRSALSTPVHSKAEQQDKNHFILVKRGYLVFYLLFTLMAVTGLIMAFEHTALPDVLQRPARQIHSTVQYLIYAYIVFHLAGVIRADMRQQKGIVSAMINGNMHEI